jgi:hypothetical protein
VDDIAQNVLERNTVDDIAEEDTADDVAENSEEESDQ